MGGYAANCEWQFELGAQNEGWESEATSIGQFALKDTIAVKTNGENGYCGWRGNTRGGSRSQYWQHDDPHSSLNANLATMQVDPHPFFAYDNRYTAKANNAHHFAKSRPDSRLS